MSVSVDDIDHGWFAIKKELKKFKRSYTAIGYYGHGGDPSNDLAARAIIQELGKTIKVTEKMRNFWRFHFHVHLKKDFIIIPSRPFMRKTFDANKKKIDNQIIKEYNKILDKKQTAKQGLISLGLWYKGLTQLTIRKGGFTPNSPLTIKMKRGSTKPLIGMSGQLFNEIQHREFKI
jgi:hypothetical protein